MHVREKVGRVIGRGIGRQKSDAREESASEKIGCRLDNLGTWIRVIKSWGKEEELYVTLHISYFFETDKINTFFATLARSSQGQRRELEWKLVEYDPRKKFVHNCTSPLPPSPSSIESSCRNFLRQNHADRGQMTKRNRA